MSVVVMNSINSSWSRRTSFLLVPSAALTSPLPVSSWRLLHLPILPLSTSLEQSQPRPTLLGKFCSHLSVDRLLTLNNSYDNVPSETCEYGHVTTVPATDSSPEPTEAATATPQKREALPLPSAQVARYPTIRLSSVCSFLVTPSTVITTMTSTASPEYETEMVSCWAREV